MTFKVFDSAEIWKLCEKQGCWDTNFSCMEKSEHRTIRFWFSVEWRSTSEILEQLQAPMLHWMRKKKQIHIFCNVSL